MDDADRYRQVFMSDDGPAPGAGPAPTPAAHAPLPEDTTDYENAPWSDVAQKAASQILPSTGAALSGIGHAIVHPIETAQALGQVGSGLISKAQGAVGVQQDPKDKAATEALVDALGKHYSDSYGSVAGFKKALATDPASVGMDIGSVLTMGSGAAANAPGVIGKAAGLAGQAAKFVDPVQAALRVAGTAAKVPLGAAKYVQAGATGVPVKALNIARAAGQTADPELRGAFTQFMSGQGNHADIADTALNAVQELKDNASARYLSDRANLAKAQTPLPMDKIQSALDDFGAYINHGGAQTRFPGAHKVYQQVADQIGETAADPALRTTLGLDNLKQSLNDLYRSVEGTPAANKIAPISAAVKQTIVDQDPIYAKMMDDWQNWRTKLLDYQKTLGLNKNTAQTAQIGKLLRAGKTDQGQSLLNALSGTQSGRTLPYMLAGAAVHPALPEGLARLMEAPALGLGYLIHPDLLLGPAAAGAMTSPRLAGASQYAAGRASRYVAPMTSPPLPLAAAQIGEQEQRQGRASGGRTGIDHASVAAHLVRSVEHVRKAQSKTTEPLLKVPDEAIARSLAVANQGI